MALSRYGGIDGSQRISQNYDEINKAFKNVETEADSNKGIVDQHINNSDIHVTKAKQDDWDSKAPGIVKEQLDSHVSNHSLHVSGEERTKLSTIEVGAEPNQNAFSRVNGMAATSKTDEFKIVGDVGIEVTQNPNDKSIHLTATGTAAPGKHASTHLTGGTDPIPTATETTSGLMAPADKQALNTLKKAIDRVDLTTTLGPGTSVINADQASDLDLTVYGATLTNLLGSDGNFETDSNGDGVADGWANVGDKVRFSLVTTNVKYGLKAQRITALATDTAQWVRRMGLNANIIAGKKYAVVADVVTDGTATGHVQFRYSDTATVSKGDITSNTIVVLKASPIADYVGGITLYNSSLPGVAGWVQFDGVGIYEVSDDLYNRIGVDINESNIRDYLPHVDGRQHVQGVLITKSDVSEPQRLILPVTLASTPDGLTRDRAYYRDGAWRLLKCVDTTVNPAVALANPVESVIIKEGDIKLHPGGNQITVETGVIWREKVTFDSGTKRATTSKRSARVIGVYKGADVEPFTTSTSGAQTLPQLVNAVESGKDYYVTYITLDKYAYTANITQTDAKYTAGLSGAVSGALRDVARLQVQNDRQDFADDYIEAKVDNLRIDTDAQLADIADNKVNKGELVINVRDYGAVANGTTDDSAAIQAAINAAYALGGGKVYIPVGNYFIGSTLVLRSGVQLVGGGYTNWDYRKSKGTWLIMKKSLPSLIDIGNGTTGIISGAALSNMSLTVEGFTTGGTVTGIGLWERNSWYFHSENIYIEGFSTGIKIGDISKTLSHHYTNTHVSDCDVFIEVNNGGDVTFDGGRIGTNAGSVARTAGIVVKGNCDSLVFNRLIVAHNSGLSYNVHILDSTSLFWITFNDCDFETATVASVQIETQVTMVRVNNSWIGSKAPMIISSGSRIIVRDCTFGNQGSLPAAINITGTASNVTVEQNDFTTAPSAQIKVDTSGSGITVRNNTIQGGGIGIQFAPVSGTPSRWIIAENNLIGQVDNAISINFAVLTKVQVKNNFISGYTNHGILLSGSTTEVSVDIQGNRLETAAASGTRRSILVNSAMSGVIITNNDLRGNAAAMVDNSVAPKLVTNNLV